MPPCQSDVVVFFAPAVMDGKSNNKKIDSMEKFNRPWTIGVFLASLKRSPAERISIREKIERERAEESFTSSLCTVCVCMLLLNGYKGKEGVYIHRGVYYVYRETQMKRRI